MAKQNLISGGFYGKVGQLVGQRWHNIRTVRSYVKPRNPRTEKQQANRYAFSKVTENAQIAMQMNYHTPAFDTTANSEWALRMSSGSMLAKSGNVGFNLIPLFPYGYIPKYTLEKITLKEKRGATSAIFEVQGDLPGKNRELSVLIGYKNAEEEEYIVDLYTALLLVGDTCTFELQMADNSVLNEMTKFLIVSNDDVNNDNEMVYCPQTLMSEPEIIERDFNADVVGIERDGNIFTITLAEPFIEAETTLENFSVYGVSSGVFKEQAFGNATLIEHNGYFAIRFTQSVIIPSDLFAFPADSTISIGKITAVNDRYNLHSADIEKEIVSTDLTRELLCTLKESGTLSGNTLVVFNQPFFTASYAKKSATAKAIINGELQSFTPTLGTVAGRNGYLTVAIEKTSYTYTDTPIFSTGSSVTFGGIRGVANGVTYMAENFTIEPRDTTTSLKFDATIESISRSGNVFTITTANKYVPNLGYTIAADISAVSNGVKVSKNSIPLSLENNGGKLAFTFTQAVQHNAELYAFPTGSTIALKAVQSSPAWGYTPSITTAQAVSNSDLTRQLWNEVERYGVNTTMTYLQMKQGATTDATITATNLKIDNVTAYGDGITENYNANVRNSALALNVNFNAGFNAFVAPTGCKVHFDNLSVISSGVQYIAEGNDFPISHIEGTANWSKIDPNTEILIDSTPAQYFDMHPLMEELYEPTDPNRWWEDWGEPKNIDFTMASTYGIPITSWTEGYLDDYDDNMILLQTDGTPLSESYLGRSVVMNESFQVECKKLGFNVLMSAYFNTVVSD